MAGDTFIGGSVGVVRLFGVPVRFHFTFLLLLAFLLFIGVGQRQSGAFTALYILALFGSVLLHELGHALVARRYGIRTIEIVMFPIGGVARLDRLPHGKQEVLIALAGPAVNLVIAGLIFGWLGVSDGKGLLATAMGEPTDVNLGLRIGIGNLILAVFNLLPAYPMDGGRVLRGLLALKRTEAEATRIAAGAGQALAVLMGLYGLLSANFLLVFVAMFVYLGAAQESMVAQGRSLASGSPVSAAMVTDFHTLEHGNTLRDAGHLLLSTAQQDFPVRYGDRIIGLLTRAALMRGMMSEGPDAYVSTVMDRDFKRIAPNTDLAEALPTLGATCVLVMEGETLLGLLTAENLSEFLVLRQIDIAQARHAGQ
jgi:Zn-dependent protease/CBS domain-containing protein